MSRSMAADFAQFPIFCAKPVRRALTWSSGGFLDDVSAAALIRW